MSVKEFFRNAFQDMKDSAQAQHEVDKASFAAAKAESRAQWEEAKAMSDPQKRKKPCRRRETRRLRRRRREFQPPRPGLTLCREKKYNPDDFRYLGTFTPQDVLCQGTCFV